MASAQPTHFLPCLIFLAGLWFGLFRAVSLEWTVNPQYSFGFIVPWVCLYFAWKRSESVTTSSASKPHARLISSALACASLTIPIAVVQKANPEWRAIFWLHGAVAASATALFLGSMGGIGLVRHFAIVPIVAAAGIPWPGVIESPAVQEMMTWTAQAAVECLNWLGIPAWRKGNLIETASGVVGVNEACSGIRSLQASVLISLFWGEFFGFAVSIRAAFTLLAAVLTFSFNLVRAVALAWVAASGSMKEVEHFHDPAGWIITIAVFFSLLLLARIISKFLPPAPSQPLKSPAVRSPPSPMVSYVGIGILIVCEGSTLLWYHGANSHAPTHHWIEVKSGPENRGLEDVAVHKDILSTLRVDSARCLAWKGLEDTEGRVFLFNWSRGAISTLMTFVHQPEICLPAVGMRLVQNCGPHTFNLHEKAITAKAYKFASSSAELFIFHAKWPERSSQDGGNKIFAEPTWRNRFKEAWNHRIQARQQVIEIALSGVSDLPKAASIAQSVLTSSFTFLPTTQGAREHQDQ